jgi:hypothetical protein
MVARTQAFANAVRNGGLDKILMKTISDERHITVVEEIAGELSTWTIRGPRGINRLSDMALDEDSPLDVAPDSRCGSGCCVMQFDSKLDKTHVRKICYYRAAAGSVLVSKIELFSPGS